MITREKGLEILHTHMKSANLRRHCYAVEAVMRGLARYFSAKGREDEDKWGIVGLLHDGDYEETKDKPQKHTLLMHEWLKAAGETDGEILQAILTHNFAHIGQTFTPRSLGEVGSPKTRMEWALYTCDELTGLIVAVALVRPDKKLSSVTVESVLKKWDEKSFAAGVKREQIELCEEKLKIKLPEFIKITLEAMQKISNKIGL